MFARPDGLEDAAVRAAVRDHWAIDPGDVEYAAVGFGSQHWTAGDYFVTVDAAADAAELAVALRTASALRADAGLEFVISPIPTPDGALLRPLGKDWVIHIYERLEVVDDTAHGPHHDPEVVALVHRIHAATPAVAQHAARETFGFWDRDDLDEAMRELDEAWETGPYGEPCRDALRANTACVTGALARFDSAAAKVDPDGWVVTHGEPHRGNIFRTTKGWAVVDWDTVLIAPPERDFWDLPNSGGDPSLCDLYRLQWALMEVACYVSLFFDEHREDRNTRESWKNFERYLNELADWC